jgi:predicted O-methyltransferase YrrM
MFHEISDGMRARMRELEAIDSRDRADGTPQARRMRQIPPETGQFIAMLAACAPDGAHLEIGTSAGYSTMWQALAARQRGRKITTFDVSEYKIQLARETFRQAGIEDIVDLVAQDARQYIERFAQIGFCFLDAEKDLYMDCYELVIPRLVQGGLLVADNVISHQEGLQSFVEHAQADPRVDALVVAIGKGELVCRKK